MRVGGGVRGSRTRSSRVSSPTQAKSGLFFANDRGIWADREGVDMGEKGKRDKAGREPKKKPQKTIKEKRKEKREKKK